MKTAVSGEARWGIRGAVIRLILVVSRATEFSPVGGADVFLD